MIRLLGFFLSSLAVVLIIAGGPAVWEWEHRFPGYSFKGIPIVHWFAFSIPAGAFIQLEQLRAHDADELAQVKRISFHQVQITAAVNEQEGQAQARIQFIVRTNLKEVPVYVTPQADADCIVPVGFVRVHDASAAGMSLPDASSSSNDAPSAVKLSTVAATVASNYGAANANAEQLKALQGWLLQEQAAAKNPIQALR